MKKSSFDVYKKAVKEIEQGKARAKEQQKSVEKPRVTWSLSGLEWLLKLLQSK